MPSMPTNTTTLGINKTYDNFVAITLVLSVRQNGLLDAFSLSHPSTQTQMGDVIVSCNSNICVSAIFAYAAISLPTLKPLLLCAAFLF